MAEKDPLRIREILAANLLELMKLHPELNTPRKIEEESRGHISKSNADRIIKASRGTSVDNLGPLAGLFGLQPWQLLVENLDPKHLPNLTTTPLLEQIRSVVNQSGAAPDPNAEGSSDENHLAKEEVSAARKRNSDGRQTQLSPTLQSQVRVGARGDNDASRPPAAVQKPRARRRS